MKIKKMVESFNYAINGIIEAVRTQKNMKIHIFAILCMLLACFLLDVPRIEFLILAITITLVLGTEIIDTAIEVTINMSANHCHSLVKIAKNASVGTVLVTVANVLSAGYIIFWDKISDLSYDVVHKVKESEPYMIFIALVSVVLATLIIKSISEEGTPLRGGMLSGHSAPSFSITTVVSLITEEPICIVLNYLMALVTAQSGVGSNVHSIWEVIMGALFGTLLTLLMSIVFKI